VKFSGKVVSLGIRFFAVALNAASVLAFDPDSLLPLDTWAGIPAHPAKVNSVTKADSEPILSLSGEWDFVTKPWPTGVAAAKCTEDEWWPTNDVRKLTVPGCWESQGVGEPGTTVPWACFWDCSPKPIHHFYGGYGWYRKTVTLPISWADRRIWLKIGGTMSEGLFYVNGTPVARNHPYCGASKFEITHLVKAGEPVTVICGVCNLRPTRRGCAASCNHWGGIYRDVELEATPKTFIDDAWVRGDFDKRRAEAHVEIGGEMEPLKGGKVRVTVEDETADATLPLSASCLQLNLALRSLRPWSPEQPNLYTAKVELVSADGTVVQKWLERFGVRKFEVRGNDLYLNDRPFFVRGAGYHFIYPLTGVTPTDREVLRTRIRKIREAGFNYVRMHTTCEIPEFFEVADEEGLMIQPELPYYQSYPADGFNFDPFRDVRELRDNYRRHPSFVVYSIGNEGSLGLPCMKALYRYIKKTDPDRLVLGQDGGPLMTPETTDFETAPMTVWPRGLVNPPRPFLAHEYLNLCVKTDSRLADRFTGVWQAPVSRRTRADWLKGFGLNLAAGDRLQDAQHALQKYWQKYGIEAARADPLCDGYSFWSLQDACSPQKGAYSGQALFDPFFGEKPCGATARSFAVFNAPSCVLFDDEPGCRHFETDPRIRGDHKPGRADMFVEYTNRIYVSGSDIHAKFLFAHYGQAAVTDAHLRWSLGSAGKCLAGGTKAMGTQALGHARVVFDETVRVPEVEAACKAVMAAAILDGAGREIATNAWDVWVYPKRSVTDGSDVAACGIAYACLSGRYTGLKPAAEASAAKIVIAPEGSKEASAAFERRQDAITYANCFGKPNICLGWWWMGSQMGMVFEKSPLLAGLPHEPFLAPLHFRIVREGTPLPVAGFRQEDLVVYGEGGEKCYLYLAMRTLPAGNRHVMVSGLDILSSTPEGTALLDDILTALRSGKQTNE